MVPKPFLTNFLVCLLPVLTKKAMYVTFYFSNVSIALEELALSELTTQLMWRAFSARHALLIGSSQFVHYSLLFVHL